MVIETNHPLDPPHSILVLPQMDELRLAHWLGILMPRMVKPVNPDLNCAKALHVIDLHTSRHELPCHFAAYIVLHALRQRRSPKPHPPSSVSDFQSPSEI